MAELVIVTPDAKRRHVPLDAARLTLGRSSAADLSYPEDTGLSRLHVAFERTAGGHLVRDLNSKNGTTLNGARITEPRELKANDKLACGRVVILYSPATRASPAVEFVEHADDTGSATFVTSLGGVMRDASQASGPHAQLSALIRAGNELATERPLPELFRLILNLSIDAVSAGRGVLLTMENGALVPRATRGDSFQISTAVRDRVVEGKLSILVRDTTLDDALRERHSIVAQSVSTLMAVPLQARDTVIGLIYVDSPALHKPFSRDDLNLLTVMANVAAIRIEHSRLAQVEQARILMARELEQAESIQRAALPAAAPPVPGFDIAGHNAACRTVGGDYYDFFTDQAGRVALMLADVSGKGMAAALMVMALQARVQALFEDMPVQPGALAAAFVHLNRLTTANCVPGRFITVFACVLDAPSGTLTWCCAGHNPPLIVRAGGDFETLQGGNAVMGVFPDLLFDEFQARLAPGDMLAIYSDGITEACSPADDEFDAPELGATLAANRERPAREVVDAVMARVRQWTMNAPPADDMTLVIARRIKA